MPIILFYAFKPIFNVVVIELKFCLWIMQTRQDLSKSMNDKNDDQQNHESIATFFWNSVSNSN